MLSPSARPYIDASVPVLRVHGAAITQRFYANLFGAHPELKNLFNMGNQASGAQQGALAAAVLAYAANIDRPEALAPVIERIAHKHASLGITPSQYPLVGRHLLGAIKEVLGDAATPDLLSAWDEAYWLLAGELIAAEARLYERAAVEPGSLRELVVTQIAPEGPGSVSYYLQTPGGASPGSFVAGQYVSVAVDLADEGLRQLRQYSLSDSPSRPYWRITVKGERGAGEAPAGRVSNHLHAHIKHGDSLWVSAPFGNFAPLGAAGSEGASPLVLLSAGVGITPFVSALRTLADQGSTRPILFAHAALSPAHHILSKDVREAAAHLPGLRTLTFYEQHEGASDESLYSGRMALSSEQLAPFAEAEVFMCGPLAFMREQWRALLAHGFTPTRMQREVFGPELLDHLG